MEREKKGSNWTVTIQYGTAKARHFGKYTAFNSDRATAIKQANAYFAARNRTNRTLAGVQEWWNA